MSDVDAPAGGVPPPDGPSSLAAEGRSDSQALSDGLENITICEDQRVTRGSLKPREQNVKPVSTAVITPLDLEVIGGTTGTQKLGIQFIMQKQGESSFVAQNHIAIYNAAVDGAEMKVRETMEEIIQRGKEHDSNFNYTWYGLKTNFTEVPSAIGGISQGYITKEFFSVEKPKRSTVHQTKVKQESQDSEEEEEEEEEQEEEEEEEEKPVKRGRGRPKKVKIETEEVEEEEEEDDEKPVKRGRGRPRKDIKVEDEKPKRRGRPPSKKQKVDESDVVVIEDEADKLPVIPVNVFSFGFGRNIDFSAPYVEPPPSKPFRFGLPE